MGEKKVLTLLLGSPRTGGNSEKLADALAKGAEKNGWEIRRVRAAAMNLKGCLDCRMCWSKGSPCVQNDDMDRVYADIEAADAVAFVSPVYYYSWSAQIKPIWDRMLPFSSPSAPRSIKGKKAVLLSVAGDASAEAFEGVTASFRQAAAHLGWEIAGQICADDIYVRGDMETKGAALLEQASLLGASL